MTNYYIILVLIIVTIHNISVRNDHDAIMREVLKIKDYFPDKNITIVKGEHHGTICI